MATKYLLSILGQNKLTLLYENPNKTVQSRGQVLTLLDDVANYKLLYFEYCDGSNTDVIFPEMAIVENILNTTERNQFLANRYGSNSQYMALSINNTTVTVQHKSAGYLYRIYGIG